MIRQSNQWQSRDPAALPRALTTLLLIALLWPGLQLAEFRPQVLFNSQNLTRKDTESESRYSRFIPMGRT